MAQPFRALDRLTGVMLTLNIVVVGRLLNRHREAGLPHPEVFFYLFTTVFLLLPTIFYSSWMRLPRLVRLIVAMLLVGMIVWFPDTSLAKAAIFSNAYLWGSFGIALDVALLVMISWRMAKDGRGMGRAK